VRESSSVDNALIISKLPLLRVGAASQFQIWGRRSNSDIPHDSYERQIMGNKTVDGVISEEYCQRKSQEIQPTAAVPKLMRLVTGFPPRRPGFEPVSGYVDNMTLGQISEYLGPPCQSFHRLLRSHPHPGLVKYSK
jgi:hypothetical protein